MTVTVRPLFTVALSSGTLSVVSIDLYTLRLGQLTILLKMSRYYNTTLCHYWDMSVK